MTAALKFRKTLATRSSENQRFTEGSQLHSQKDRLRSTRKFMPRNNKSALIEIILVVGSHPWLFFSSWVLGSQSLAAFFFMGPWVPAPGCFSSWVLGSQSLAVFLHGPLGPSPWLFFFMGPWVPIPGCFSSWTLGPNPWLFFHGRDCIRTCVQIPLCEDNFEDEEEYLIDLTCLHDPRTWAPPWGPRRTTERGAENRSARLRAPRDNPGMAGSVVPQNTFCPSSNRSRR